MIKPQKHVREEERIKHLESYSILDTLPEEDYDNLTSIASQICGTPISLVSLVDGKRQWFKSNHGLGARETGKDIAFCAHAINDPGNVLIVRDSREDERFHDNPLVTDDPYVIFYAGVPLIGDDGLPLGTLCVIDNKPRELSKDQIDSLKALSKQVMNLLFLRKNKVTLEESVVELEEKNQELERFAAVAAHDLKSPLIGISGLAQVFKDTYGNVLDDEGISLLQLITKSSDQLRSMIDGLLEYSRCEKWLKERKSTIELEEFVSGLRVLFNYENELRLHLNSSVKSVDVNQTALHQIFINLIANAIKYNDKDKVEIEIGAQKLNGELHFTVKDNGPGIKPDDFQKLFRLFEVLVSKDKFGNQGNGIGLATVKKIVEKSGGQIQVESIIGEGSTFSFSLETS